MNPRSAVDTYRQDAFENAPPVKLVRMLYQGAIRFLDRAAECDAMAADSQFSHWVCRADAIVTELHLALRKEQAPEVSENLEQLYIFCERELHKALNERDAAPIAGVRKVLANLLEAWSTLEHSGAKGV